LVVSQKDHENSRTQLLVVAGAGGGQKGHLPPKLWPAKNFHHQKYKFGEKSHISGNLGAKLNILSTHVYISSVGNLFQSENCNFLPSPNF